MTKEKIDDNFQTRLKEVERQWQANFEKLLVRLNDAERTDFYRRFRMATELMREYAKVIEKKEDYFLPWVGGEFNLALAIIGVVGMFGFGLSFSDWFAGVLRLVESRSVFLSLIALAIALGWLRRAIEVETRRAVYEVQVGRYVLEWRSLGLSYVLLHESRSWMYIDDRVKRDLSEKELRIDQVMNVKLLCEVREALILDILSQRDVETWDYRNMWTDFFDLMKSDAS